MTDLEIGIINDLQNFVTSGFKAGNFTNRLYRHLSQNVGFIAHYDMHGFYTEYFPDDVYKFINEMTAYQYSWGYGDGKHKELNEALLKVMQDWKTDNTTEWDAEFWDFFNNDERCKRMCSSLKHVKLLEYVYCKGREKR